MHLKYLKILTLIFLIGVLCFVFYARQSKKIILDPRKENRTQKLSSFGAGTVTKIEAGRIYYRGSNIIDPGNHQLLPSSNLIIAFTNDTKITKQGAPVSAADIKIGSQIIVYPRDGSFKKALKIEIIP